jgi:hypothetical protein
MIIKPVNYQFEINMCFHLTLYGPVNILNSAGRPHNSLSSILRSFHLVYHLYASKVEAGIHIHVMGPLLFRKYYSTKQYHNETNQKCTHRRALYRVFN